MPKTPSTVVMGARTPTSWKVAIEARAKEVNRGYSHLMLDALHQYMEREGITPLD